MTSVAALRFGAALLLGGCAAAAPGIDTSRNLECMLVNASTLRPPDWVSSIGSGSVAATQSDWEEIWMRLTGRDEAPAKPLPPGMKAVTVTERPGSSCYSYLAVITRSRNGVLDVAYHLRDISAVAGPTGSVCLPNVAQRSLVAFVPAPDAQQVRFLRAGAVTERAPRPAPPPCPVLQR